MIWPFFIWPIFQFRFSVLYIRYTIKYEQYHIKIYLNLASDVMLQDDNYELTKLHTE